VASQYYYGTGRRKSAVAQVRLYAGDGAMVVNGRPGAEYFTREGDLALATQPLKLTGNESTYMVSVLVKGGGVSGQTGAVQHGVARALVEAKPELRSALRAAGFLTRDPRGKERKKPGLKRARKAPQYTKR
jgi:small subunit ribosomal protein S9